MYKEECAFSFATPLAPSGLFLNLKTWQSYSEEYLELDRERTSNCLYLWEKWHKVGRADSHMGSLHRLCLVPGPIVHDRPGVHAKHATAMCADIAF